ncbi:MAG TPA: DUF6498-containing protein [Burkholderiales bacterium]|jgi:hypothetical protein
MPDTPAIDWVSKPCPKCGYIRTRLDTNPAWQCPRCRIAYAKYAAQAAQLRQSLAMHGREMTERAKSDHSLLLLVAVNAVALGVAYYLHMSLRGLMLVYWIQSVVIGVMNVIRILRLRRFATAGFTINDKPVTETPSSKRTVATFFALHYGLFHAVYLLYIVADSKGTFATPAGRTSAR